MTALASMLRQAINLHVEHWRPCRECRGTGWKPRVLGAPGGVPVRKVVARIQCGECKGAGKTQLFAQHRERGVERVYEHGKRVR